MVSKKKKAPEVVTPTGPIRLDIGCGKNKQPGHLGVDSLSFEGVDVVMDVRQTPWPWADGQIESAYSSHFVEHLSREEWIPFFNELHRVLRVGGTAQIITPHAFHECAYGDPTHKSFLTGWVAYYLNKGWRDVNAPHAGYTCDFDFTIAGSWDPRLETRQDKTFPMNNYVNNYRDLIINLTKRP